MSDLHPALVELLQDPQGQRAVSQLRPLVESLMTEGVPPRAICRALAQMTMSTCLSEYERWGSNRIWAKQFLRELEGAVRNTSLDIDIMEEQAVAAQRNRDAGGNGTCFQ